LDKSPQCQNVLKPAIWDLNKKTCNQSAGVSSY